ncbi:MAG: transcription-repair coupling factor [Peptococcaceae bacterium]|jgi:transcription-repair coupling factor (superfamily II helicase)|nr:transcription-repair coupling factor [Peptococcaceae bacterium]MDH7526080.1 transcription-repair coupling factor [Peptococcaceae bacterium]
MKIEKIDLINEYLRKSKEFKFLLEQLRQDGDSLVYGITGSLKSLLAALVVKNQQKPALYIVENTQRGKEVFDDLSNLLAGITVHFFPALDLLPFEVIARSRETQRKRLEVLQGLVGGQKSVVVATLEAVSKVLVSPDVFASSTLTLSVGQKVKVDELLKRLLDIGYQRADLVEDKGQVSLRGGILDLFPATAENPYRFEFFDDEIESIRVFSTENQRSTGKITGVTVSPAAEFFFPALEREKAVEKIEKEACQLLRAMEKKGNRNGYENLAARVKEIVNGVKEGLCFPGYEQYLPYFSEKKYSLLDYFPETPLLIIDEPNRQRESFLLSEKETQETFKTLLEKGQILPGQINNYFNFEELWSIFSPRKKIYYSLLPKKPAGAERVNALGITARTVGLFMGKIRLLADELKEWRRQKFAALVFVNSAERGERLKQGLWDLGIEAVVTEGGFDLQPEKIYITTGYLSGGFELTAWKLAVLTEHELFFQPKKRVPRRMFQEGKRSTVLEDLKIGDYVVHVNHGIGKYMGIEKLAVGEAERDYLVIKYHGEDKLYVPTDQSGLLQKYFSQEGQLPKLSKLGGSDWNRVKNRVKAAVRDLAEELLSLYAARQSAPGYAFAGDSPWQRDFEEAFPYEETPDQVRAIREVKKDMEMPRPMDRLLCGDVGYGKTEVAIRAAFKAVTSGKQVAVLVPTTVLAQQHYNTFRERFEGFAVSVGVLSRFRTPKEQKEIIKDLKAGKIDIIIGTHRLLSSDVKFKDLGLLVVDEEQRFGVVHKEKLKKLKTNVDVLTLTATPIPRTLHMALAGVRDMSLIETPPEDRYPVQTFVVEHSPQLIREAIRRELGRGGQVYYVHNRIEDIDRVAAFIQELVPEARIGVGHGRMGEEHLEKVMLDFMEDKIDVLVSTTIIESGLDISNVNTLIVDDADKLGLSQLYQLRGRVGRSNRVAYAYLTYNKDKILSEIAEKRLNAIREFTELGSGFKIAMKDLEIRGAGNILGAEQHGHVEAVGFDLYCRMLEEAVREARGEELPPEKAVSIDIQVKAYIPQEYIHDTGTKIDFYQRIYAAKTLDDLDLLKEELEDRFGAPPEPLLNLLKIAAIKVLAAGSKVHSVVQEKNVIKLKLEDDHGLSGRNLMDLARRYRRQVSFSASAGLEIMVNTQNLEMQQVLQLIEEIILEISTIAGKEAALV